MNIRKKPIYKIAFIFHGGKNMHIDIKNLILLQFLMKVYSVESTYYLAWIPNMKIIE